MAKVKKLNGIIPAERVRRFVRSIAKEMFFHTDEEVAGRAIIKDNYILSVFTIGNKELTIKMKEAI